MTSATHEFYEELLIDLVCHDCDYKSWVPLEVPQHLLIGFECRGCKDQLTMKLARIQHNADLGLMNCRGSRLKLAWAVSDLGPMPPWEAYDAVYQYLEDPP